VGLVVGATAPAELERIRGIAPGLALLVPGVGAQGGEVGPALRFGPAVDLPAGGRPGGGLLVNVSRGISGAAGSAAGSTAGAADASAPAGDVAERLATAAAEWSARLRVAI
jgi:orotidine-5'-phosphate decarboxylase